MITEVLSGNWEMEFLSPTELIVTAVFGGCNNSRPALLHGTINGAYSPVWKSLIPNGFSHFQKSKRVKFQLDLLPFFIVVPLTLPIASFLCLLAWKAPLHIRSVLCLFIQQSWKLLIQAVSERLCKGDILCLPHLPFPLEILKCLGLLKAKVELLIEI